MVGKFMARVAVFGLGYVGCVTAACLSRDGHEVIGVDIEPAKVAEVSAGLPPINEPGLDELLSMQVKVGRLRATTDVIEAVAASEMALVAVGTPSAEDGSISTRAVEKVVLSIGEAIRAARKPYLLVVRSTLLPGVVENLLQPLLEKAVGRTVG